MARGEAAIGKGQNTKGHAIHVEEISHCPEDNEKEIEQLRRNQMCILEKSL